MRISNRVVYWVIGLLLVLAGLLYLIMPKDDPNSASLTVISNNQQEKTFTMEEIQQLPAVDREVTIRSSSEGTKTHVFTGTPVQEVLASIDTDILTNIKNITVKGLDSYTVVFTYDEVMLDDNVLLVYAQDGQPLASKTKGGTGPFRIIVLGDQFGIRAVKYVTALEVN